MSDRLPYEDYLKDQWNDLPLPDENLAWDDMRRRLDEEDDGPVAAWWRRGCMGWGLLLLILVCVGWFWIDPLKWFTKGSQETVQTSEHPTTTENENGSGFTDTSLTYRNKTTSEKNDGGSDQSQSSIQTLRNQKYRDSTTEKALLRKTNPNTSRTRLQKASVPAVQPSAQAAKYRRNKSVSATKPGSQPSAPAPKSGRNKSVSATKPVSQPSAPAEKDSIVVSLNEKILNADNTDSLISKPSSSPDTSKTVTGLKLSRKSQPDSTSPTNAGKKKINRIYYSAGIGLHQQIPLFGQKLTPYNSLGRKGSILDYIPSLHFRVNKEKRWFIQAEFRYGAPQLSDTFSISQESVAAGTKTEITTRVLNKSYYHQIPLTFNLYVVPSLSVGAGVIWNKFSTAIVDEIKYARDNVTLRDSLLAMQFNVRAKPKEFAKSYLQGILETEYKYKRFAIGGRYTFGLQPYIKFNLPGQPLQKEVNKSLQLFLRYELWKQKE